MHRIAQNDYPVATRSFPPYERLEYRAWGDNMVEAIFLLIGGTFGYLRRCVGIAMREEQFVGQRPRRSGSARKGARSTTFVSSAVGDAN